MSEAGVPAVADPGADLVRLAHQHGITVRPLVGPSSLLLAVMASGLNGQSFAFNGYLPTDAALAEAHPGTGETLAQRKADATADRNAVPQRRHAGSAGRCLPAGTLICVATDLTLASESMRTLAASHWKRDISEGGCPTFTRSRRCFRCLPNEPAPQP